MGKCFGKCLPIPETKNILNRSQNSDVEFAFLVEDGAIPRGGVKRSLFSRLFNKRNDSQKPVLDLVDGLLNPQLTAYSRLNESQRLPSDSKDIQLQCLDARALLSRTAASTPSNSLDLEWEHETLPMEQPSWTAPTEDASQSVDSDWSRVSSANSLEWDNVTNSIMSEVDTDTQFLLSEIERLTNQTLRETGRELFS